MRNGKWVSIERDKFKCNKLTKELITNNINPAPPPCQVEEQLIDDNKPTINIAQGNDNLAQALKWQKQMRVKELTGNPHRSRTKTNK